ncbi:MAG: LapA family protein [Ignavibacteriales bacterium]
MRFVKIVILAVFFILILAIIIQNQEVFTHKFDIGLNLKFYQIGPYTISNIGLIAITFFIGVIFAIIWGAFYSVSMRSQIKEKENRIKELESQKKEIQIPKFGESAPVQEATKK